MLSESQQAVLADGRDADYGNGPEGWQFARDDAAAPRPAIVRLPGLAGPRPHARPRPASPSAAPPTPGAADAPPASAASAPPAAPATAPARAAAQQQQLDQQEPEHRPREAAHERVHGVVPRAAPQDGPGEPQDAQLGDLQALGRRVEAAQRVREAAVHRRGQAAAGRAHEGAPRLQIPAAAQDQDAAQEGQVPVRNDEPAPERGPVAIGGVGGPAGRGPRHVPDAERVHAQRVHDARRLGLPAAVRGCELRAVRHGTDAAQRVHERWLWLRGYGAQQCRVAVRDAAGRVVAQPVGIEHKIGTGVA